VPISWGVSETPGWGYQMAPLRVLQEMRSLGMRASEMGPHGYFAQDNVAKVEVEPSPTQESPKPEPTAKPTAESFFTLSDIESIGFKKTEDTTSTWDYEHLLEGWDGEILVNGTSQYFGVLIFGEAVDKFTKEQFTQVGLMVSVRTAVIHNIAIACHAQEVCDYVIEKLR
jgi:hypothetical protein